MNQEKNDTPVFLKNIRISLRPRLATFGRHAQQKIDVTRGVEEVLMNSFPIQQL